MDAALLPAALLAVEGDKHTLLDPDGAGLVFWTAVTFAFAALILYRVAWGPLQKALVDREAAIDGAILGAEKTRLEAEAVKQRYEQQLEGIRREAQSIIDEGTADKKRIIEEAQRKAGHEAQEIRARAEREILLARDKALAEVKGDAVALGLMIAERVIAADLDKQKHRAIAEQVVAGYETAKRG